MTPSECVRLAAEKHHLLFNAGELLFNTFDLRVANWWERQGATVLPWYSEKEIAFLNRGDRSTQQGYEVRLKSCVEDPAALIAQYRMLQR
jgi:hypothetical protein